MKKKSKIDGTKEYYLNQRIQEEQKRSKDTIVITNIK